jgi:hypothetical protein
MKHTVLLAWAAVTLVGVSSCASKKSSVNRDQLLSDLVSAVCTSVTGCCSQASLELDDQKCYNDVVGRMGLTIQDPLLAYDENQAGDCLDQMKASVEACQTVDYSPCLAAFSGNRPPGATCSQALDCAAGQYGNVVCTSDGHCLQPQRGAPGQPCSYSCIDSAAGASCENIYQGGGDPANQVSCHSWDNLYCSSRASGTCQPIGSDCRELPNNTCPDGLSCDLSSGACVAPIPVGAPCPQMTGCGSAAYCNNGTCTPVKPLHSLCAIDDECSSHRCVKGVCTPMSPVAAALCYDPAPR